MGTDLVNFLLHVRARIPDGSNARSRRLSPGVGTRNFRHPFSSGSSDEDRRRFCRSLPVRGKGLPRHSSGPQADISVVHPVMNLLELQLFFELSPPRLTNATELMIRKINPKVFCEAITLLHSLHTRARPWAKIKIIHERIGPFDST